MVLDTVGNFDLGYACKLSSTKKVDAVYPQGCIVGLSVDGLRSDSDS